ncbi:spermathecal physiology variant [Anaeramoeba ignava]|uniref:Spermathecal physiology variant n=1 Tax=Anaeramoeba ignava TaxID=1746090 RepID=A0A9Q0LX26_ANAIG|nr:spermathecal physiology variant [Anaeramoeba ignava]
MKAVFGRSKGKVFGMKLDPNQPVHPFVQSCIEYIRGNGLTREEIIFDSFGVDVVCSLLKRYIQDLQVPLLPLNHFMQILDYSPNRKVRAISEIFPKIPSQNQVLLFSILELFSDIISKEQQNLMNIEKLSSIFAPLILRFEKGMENKFADHFNIENQNLSSVISVLIQNYKKIMRKTILRKNSKNNINLTQNTQMSESIQRSNSSQSVKIQSDLSDNEQVQTKVSRKQLKKMEKEDKEEKERVIEMLEKELTFLKKQQFALKERNINKFEKIRKRTNEQKKLFDDFTKQIQDHHTQKISDLDQISNLAKQSEEIDEICKNLEQECEILSKKIEEKEKEFHNSSEELKDSRLKFEKFIEETNFQIFRLQFDYRWLLEYRSQLERIQQNFAHEIRESIENEKNAKIQSIILKQQIRSFGSKIPELQKNYDEKKQELNQQERDLIDLSHALNEERERMAKIYNENESEIARLSYIYNNKIQQNDLLIKNQDLLDSEFKFSTEFLPQLEQEVQKAQEFSDQQEKYLQILAIHYSKLNQKK